VCRCNRRAVRQARGQGKTTLAPRQARHQDKTYSCQHTRPRAGRRASTRALANNYIQRQHPHSSTIRYNYHHTKQRDRAIRVTDKAASGDEAHALALSNDKPRCGDEMQLRVEVWMKDSRSVDERQAMSIPSSLPYHLHPVNTHTHVTRLRPQLFDRERFRKCLTASVANLANTSNIQFVCG
jgi:hypothetical protein